MGSKQDRIKKQNEAWLKRDAHKKPKDKYKHPWHETDWIVKTRQERDRNRLNFREHDILG